MVEYKTLIVYEGTTGDKQLTNEAKNGWKVVHRQLLPNIDPVMAAYQYSILLERPSDGV